MKRVLALIPAALGALALGGVSDGDTPADFPLGRNAEQQACRAQSRFDGTGAASGLDVYCGAWERPSGTLAPVSSAAVLEAECRGARTPLTGSGLDEAVQVACASDGAGGLRRFGLIARRGGRTYVGTAYPADWAPLLTAARVMLGAAPPPAANAEAPPDTAGLREIRSVFPEGAPGQSAAANYELLRRRAYEKNILWNFASSERDFGALLVAHRRVAPDDVAGEAEILGEIGLNLSGAGRFLEAGEALGRAEAAARRAENPLLTSKILNYRALDAMNQRRFSQALTLARQANEIRVQISRAGEPGQVRVSSADSPEIGLRRAFRRSARALLVGVEEADPVERLAVLDAQGWYVAASATRALNRAGASGDLDRADTALSASQNPPPWLTALIYGERARQLAAAGRVGEAESVVQTGLDRIRSQAPNSRPLAHLMLTQASVQRRAARAEQALATSKAALDLFSSQVEAPGLPPDLADEHLAALQASWAGGANASAAADYVEAMALVWDGAAARSAAQLAARLATGEAAGEARAYQDAERSYRAALARRERLVGQQGAPAEQLDAADTAVRDAARAYERAEDALRARSPRFLELLNPRVSAADLQASLGPDEGYLRIVMAAGRGHAVLVTRTAVTPYQIALTSAEADRLAERLHRSNVPRRNRLPDYDLESAGRLYAALIRPVEARLAGVRRLQIDAPGALAAVPYAALVTGTPDQATLQRIRSDQDYTGVPWFARRVAVAQAVGPASFVRVRRARPPSGALRAAAFGDFTPQPRQVAQRLASARGLSDRCREEVAGALSRLPRLPTTRQEVEGTARLFGGASQAEVGEGFTDTAFLRNEDAANADVLIVATHGVLGLSSCFPEPALLTSLGQEGDGLIEASELLDRRLSARLVVLSACDTAGGGRASIERTGLADGGEALSGLARGFLYAGASSVMATQWKVDEEASATETGRFFRAALQPGVTLADALNRAQAEAYEIAETAHPFYWAGFTLIGDGGVQLRPASAPATTTASAPAGSGRG